MERSLRSFTVRLTSGGEKVMIINVSVKKIEASLGEAGQVLRGSFVPDLSADACNDEVE